MTNPLSGNSRSDRRWRDRARRHLRERLLFPILRVRHIARALPFKQPPILLLSYPRSGSSWIGEVLSYSPDFAYLREPVTQPYLATFPRGQLPSSVFRPAPGTPPEAQYRELAAAAFAGAPPNELLDDSFGARAFLPPGRGHRRLLVKEVNLRAIEWYMQEFAPELLVLVRHPAAVADSHLRAGWSSAELMEDFGRDYGADLAQALQMTEQHRATLLMYEDFATDPAKHFAGLFRQLNVRTPERFDRLIAAYSNATTPPTSRYAVRRQSHAEVAKWKDTLMPATIDAVRRGYLATTPRLYAAPGDWP